MEIKQHTSEKQIGHGWKMSWNKQKWSTSAKTYGMLQTVIRRNFIVTNTCIKKEKMISNNVTFNLKELENQ